MTDTTSKTRPGIRASDDDMPGIVGKHVTDGIRDGWYFTLTRTGYEGTIVQIFPSDKLTPLPFKPGDRVHVGGNVAPADYAGTVVAAGADIESYTHVHIDGTSGIQPIPTMHLALLDYPARRSNDQADQQKLHPPTP